MPSNAEVISGALRSGEFIIVANEVRPDALLESLDASGCVLLDAVTILTEFEKNWVTTSSRFGTPSVVDYAAALAAGMKRRYEL